MNLADFRATLADATPPPELTHALQALWYDAKGDWQAAHEQAQAQEDAAGAWVHAYLHRKEGDQSNAAYWYRRATRPIPTESLESEWIAIIENLIGER